MSIDTQTLGSPVDKKAGLSYAKGDKFEIKPGAPSNVMWSSPKKTIAVPNNMEDLTGMIKGRLKVLGLMESKKKGKWLVRCSCGNYHCRKTEALNNPKNRNDMCHDCYKHLRVAREYVSTAFFEKHGVWPHQSSSSEAKKIIERYG